MAFLSRGGVPAFEAARLQGVVDRQIKRAGMAAALRRASGDRPCWMFFSQWTAKDLMGGLIDPLDRLVIMSAADLSVPPEFPQDRLITWVQPYDRDNPVESENLRIQQQPERIAPSGVVICWKLRVRR
jgi:hypothetical protein